MIEHTGQETLVNSMQQFAHRRLHQLCMPDKAGDGRNVALNCQVFPGVFDSPKKNQATSTLGHMQLLQNNFRIHKSILLHNACQTRTNFVLHVYNI